MPFSAYNDIGLLKKNPLLASVYGGKMNRSSMSSRTSSFMKMHKRAIKEGALHRDDYIERVRPRYERYKAERKAIAEPFEKNRQYAEKVVQFNKKKGVKYPGDDERGRKKALAKSSAFLKTQEGYVDTQKQLLADKAGLWGGFFGRDVYDPNMNFQKFDLMKYARERKEMQYQAKKSRGASKRELARVSRSGARPFYFGTNPYIKPFWWRHADRGESPYRSGIQVNRLRRGINVYS
jgi:hypothetical protein